jgi:transglutaminase-like putative cysteine protease
MSGRPDLSAWDILQRGYGVCRDFAHLAVALNRTFNVPARYVTGHLPDIGFPDPEGHMDFHAYAEVYLGGNGSRPTRGSTCRGSGASWCRAGWTPSTGRSRRSTAARC